MQRPSHKSPFDENPARIGRYRIRFGLAGGGMAEVYAAERECGGAWQRTALKRMRPALRSDPAFVEMFLDEARLGMLLSHPNLCRVEEQVMLSGEHCLAMEYLHGVTLASLAAACARAGRTLPLSVVLGIIVQACHGLQYAHELRDDAQRALHVIHRDVSPPNIMVCADGTVKVLDFGIAKAENSSHVTHAGSVKGKTAYMSPEQFQGMPLDRRTDIWSLGVVLLEALAGHNPFRRESLGETAFGIAYGPIPALETLVPDAPPALSAVVAKALRRDRDDRFATAGDLATAIVGAVGPSAVATNAALADFVGEMCGPSLDERERLFRRPFPAVLSSPLGPDEAPFAAAAVTSGAVRLEPSRAPKARRARLGPIWASGLSALVSAVIVLAFRGSEPAWNPSLGVPAVSGPARAGAQGRKVESTPRQPPSPSTELSAPIRDAVSLRSVPTVIAAPAPTTAAAPGAPSLALRRRAGTRAETAEPSAPQRSDAEVPNYRQRSREAEGTDERAGAAPGHEEPAMAPAFGLLFFDSQPYATVYIGGRKLGVTPILGASLPEGKYRLRAIREDGQVRELPVEVNAKEPFRRRLTW